MLGACGGHGDYAGNEVDALLLNTATPQWTQLHAPTPTADIINATQFYLDYRPSATHTYYATQFIDSLDRMVIVDSPGMGWAALPNPPAGWPYGNGGPNGWNFSFDVAINDWDLPTESGYPIANFPGTGDWTACLCVKHQTTNDLYYSQNGGAFYHWSSTTNTWTMVNSNVNFGGYAGSAIDPTRNRIFVVGSYSGNTAPQILDLTATPVPGLATNGAAASVLATASGYPGVIYDEVNDTFLVFLNDAGSNSIAIYRVNASTFAVDQPVVGGTPPQTRQNGILNSVQYVPELRGFVIANSYTGNVFFMRTSA